MCDICQGPMKIASLHKAGKIHVCLNCGFVKKDPESLLNPELEKHRYVLHNNDENNKTYLQYLNALIDLFIPYVKGTQLLDYGCGESQVMVKLFLERGYDAKGYDYFFVPDKTALSEVYDTIVCVETAEHFYAPMVDFKVIVNALRYGGNLIVKTVFKPQLTHFDDWWYHRDETHVSFYDVFVFEHIARELGLKIIDHNAKDIIIFEKVNPEKIDKEESNYVCIH